MASAARTEYDRLVAVMLANKVDPLRALTSEELERYYELRARFDPPVLTDVLDRALRGGR